MKKIFTTLLIFALVSFGYSQRANIKIEPVTPERLHKLGFPTQSVSSGLNMVGAETCVYTSAPNIGNTDPITNAV